MNQISGHADLPVALVGTYPPRRCGIATFTRDISAAIYAAGAPASPMIIAVNDLGGQYEYPSEVKYEIRQGNKGDYASAAEFVNYSDVRIVSIQHEHGIFGGDDGAYILDFLTALHVPAIATLHTVLKQPSDLQRSIIQKNVPSMRATCCDEQGCRGSAQEFLRGGGEKDPFYSARNSRDGAPRPETIEGEVRSLEPADVADVWAFGTQ